MSAIDPSEAKIDFAAARGPFAAPVLYAKGIAMGLGDSVPGVSGGTIAVISNIYERLIYAIRSCDLHAAKLVLRGDLKTFWRHIDGHFLLVLGLGILSGLLLSANTVLYLLEHFVEPLMAFFCGLVLASAFLLRQEFDYWRSRGLVAIVGGLLLALGTGLINPQSVAVSLPYLFFSGMIAICAMILPGLSGAYLLLILGVYEFVLAALVQFELVSILVFASGCVIGLLSFSRILAWLLNRHHQLSYGVITGMLLGSVTLLWPWQEIVSTYVDSSGELQALQTRNVWPLNYTEVSGNDALLLACLASFAAGLAIVILMRYLFASQEKIDK